MTSEEWWLIFDMRREDREMLDRKPSRKTYKHLTELARKRRGRDELLRVARNGKFR